MSLFVIKRRRGGPLGGTRPWHGFLREKCLGRGLLGWPYTTHVKLRTGIVGGPFWFKGRKGGFLIHAVHRIHQLQRISLEEWKDAGRERTAGSCWRQEPRFSLAPKASWNDESAKPAGFPSRLPGQFPNSENRFWGFFFWVYLVPQSGRPQETRIPVKGTTEHIFLLIRRSEVCPDSESRFQHTSRDLRDYYTDDIYRFESAY